MSDLTEYQQPGIDVTAVCKLKHADLWIAAKTLGSQAALARHLDIPPSELGEWINLKRVPPAEAVPSSKRWTKEYIASLESKLFALTHKTWDDLFPQHLRDNAAFLDCGKTIEHTARLQADALERYAIASTERMERLSLPSRNLERDEMRDEIRESLRVLDFRARDIIEFRYGLSDGVTHTLSETSNVFKVSKERIRQIEARALSTLRNSNAIRLLADERQLTKENPCQP